MPKNNQFNIDLNIGHQKTLYTSIFRELLQDDDDPLNSLVVVDGEVFRARSAIQNKGILKRLICQAVVKYNLPHTWPANVLHQIKSIPEKVEESEMKGRVDLRSIPLVTIDSEDTHDLNAAVFCQKEDDKFHLIVATADVSYYVRTGSAIDHEALERQANFYFPYYVIPMLPVELSNGICSLNPYVDRLCMICDMIINQNGIIERYGFYPAVMKSHARLTYTEAHHIIAQGEAINIAHKRCVPWIKNLYEVYQALRKASEARGSFYFESAKIHFLFDQNGKLEGMGLEKRNEAHDLIEECMIAANICAASFVQTNNYNSLYRIQQKPSTESLKKLRATLSHYGINLAGGNNPTPRDFYLVLSQIDRLPENEQQIVAQDVLNSIEKACYSADNIGHFGLALESYAQFTSPIRRYPDIQIHRVIKLILENQKERSWGNIGARYYSHVELAKLGLKYTEYENIVENTEYEVSTALICEYLKTFINKVVQATVSVAPISFGGPTAPLFGWVTLNDFFTEALITISKSHNYTNAKTYHVGDQMLVRIIDVNSDMGSNEFGIKVQPVADIESNGNDDRITYFNILKPQDISDTQAKKRKALKNLFTILGLAIPIAIVASWDFLGSTSGSGSEQSRASMLFDQCKANDAEACTQLGLMYRDGEEVRINPYVAQSLLTKACSLQNADACEYLGQTYAKGKAVDIRALPDLPGQANYSEQDIEQLRIMLLESENSRNVLEFESEKTLQ